MCLTAICRSFYKRKKNYLKGATYLRQWRTKKALKCLTEDIVFIDDPKRRSALHLPIYIKMSSLFFCTRKVNNLIKVYSPCLVFFFLMIILTIKKHPPNVSKEEQIKYIIVTSSQLCQQRSIHYLQFRWHKAISEW